MIDPKIVDAIIAALAGRGAHQSGDEIKYRCLRHDDEHPSASFNVSKAAWFCHVCSKGGGALDFARELRLQINTSKSPKMGEKTRFQIKNERGETVAVHVRLDFIEGGKTRKSIWWEQPDGTRGLGGIGLVDLPLYGLPDLLAAQKGRVVIVVEGEKKRDALMEKGILAVATVTGAGLTPGKGVLKVLAEFDVFLWPDNDKVGRDHMAKIAKKLHAFGVDAKIVVWAEAPPGGDAGDFLGQGKTAGDVQALLDEAESIGTEGGDEADEAEEVENEKANEVKKEPLMRTPEPWPDPVDGTLLLNELVAAVLMFVVVPRVSAVGVSLWVILTYLLDVARANPRLLISSAEKRSGKSKLLEVLTLLVHKPLTVANMSTATLFRMIEKYKPTVLFDEFDRLDMSQRSEFLGMLNAGHTRNAANIVRCNPKTFEPEMFNVFSPMALCHKGGIPKVLDTLLDRSIEIKMKRRRKDESILRLSSVKPPQELLNLSRKIARWADDNRASVGALDPEPLACLDDRANDGWSILLAIADACGGEWGNEARKTARVLSGDREEDDSLGVDLLKDIRGILAERGVEKIGSADLCHELASLEDRPWGDVVRGKEITPRWLAEHLKPFNVSPRTVRLSESSTPKGYERGWFTDAFERYLPPPSNATPPQSTPAPSGSGLDADFDISNEFKDTRTSATPKPLSDNSVADVAAGKGEGGQVNDESVPLSMVNKVPEGPLNCHVCSGVQFWRTSEGCVACLKCFPPESAECVQQWLWRSTDVG